MSIAHTMEANTTLATIYPRDATVLAAACACVFSVVGVIERNRVPDEQHRVSSTVIVGLLDCCSFSFLIPNQ
ncbi:unnamed protein product [Leptidea sinapis]|uniref:Uncharacterized protein n=1 Tax=Leptidea sinapis TaxID=189913 RepID=A0A5E4QDY7_9NEOP|nr:unnamed protein product [Leptidea sinapis]